MMAHPSLFPESPEEYIERLDGEIVRLTFGARGGRLDLPLDEEARAVLRCVRFHRGIKNPINIRAISQTTGIDARGIKQAIRTMRLDYRLPIGSSKMAEGGGYFLMVSAEDRAIWRKDVTDQVRAQVEVLRAADGEQAALEALGQLRAELLDQGETKVPSA